MSPNATNLQNTTESTKNPIENSGAISRTFFFWINKYLRRQKQLEGDFIQEDHFDLAKTDLIEANYSVLAKKLDQRIKAGGSIAGAITRTYFCQISWMSVLILIYAAINFYTAYVLAEIVKVIEGNGKEGFHNFEQVKPVMIQFIVIVLSFFVSGVIYSYVIFEVTRISYLLRSSVMVVIFEKMLKMNNLNFSEHSEGKITPLLIFFLRYFNTENLIFLSWDF